MTEKTKPRRLNERLRLVIVAVLVLLVLLFMLLNMEAIEVNLIFAKITIRRSIMIIGVLAVGFAAGWMTKSHVRPTDTGVG